MKLITLAFAILLFILPSISSAAALTQQQSTSLIAVVQSSPGTPASAFVSLITAFSNITVTQTTSLITVVQASPSTPANAFVGLLVSFTEDTPAVQLTTPTTASSDVCTNIEGVQTTVPGGMTATGNVCIAIQVNTQIPTSAPSVPQVTKDLILNVITDLPVPFSGFHQARIEAKYTENGKEVGVSKSYSLSNGESKTFQGDLFDVTPKSLNDITVTVTAGGLMKTINIPVIKYVKVDPSTTFIDKKAVLSLGDSIQIGEFTIKDGDESPMTLDKIQGVTDAPQGTVYTISYYSVTSQQSSSQVTQSNSAVSFTGLNASSAKSLGTQEKKNMNIRINATPPSIPGNYSLTITSLRVVSSSGNYRDVQGLPIIFTFEVKDIPNPEVIPIKTAYIHHVINESSWPPLDPGTIGSFNIKMTPNSCIKIESYKVRIDGGETKVLSGGGALGNGGHLCIVGGENKSSDTDNNGITKFPFVLSAQDLMIDGITNRSWNYSVNSPSVSLGKIKFYIEDIKVLDTRTGAVRSVTNPPVFELEIAMP